MEIIKKFWQKAWWSKLIVIIVGIFILSAIIGGLTPQGQKSFKEGQEAGKGKSENQEKPTPKVETKESKNTPVPTKKPAPTSTSFNKNRGNNPVAAELAQQLYDQANEAQQGFVLDIHVGLDPEDMQGKNKEDYIKTVKVAALSMQVDASLWSSFDEDTQRGLVTLYLKYPLGIFPSRIVGVTIIDSNNRIVAKGTYDKSTDKANITLM